MTVGESGPVTGLTLASGGSSAVRATASQRQAGVPRLGWRFLSASGGSSAVEETRKLSGFFRRRAGVPRSEKHRKRKEKKA